MIETGQVSNDAVEDDELVEVLAREKIVLETCPSSNVSTGVYDRPDEVPLRRLFDRGVALTVNSHFHDSFNHFPVSSCNPHDIE